MAVLRGLSRVERWKLGLLGGWFFLTTATLWLLKPVRNASLLAHLGSTELPHVRLGSVVVVAIVVAIYSRVVDRLTRVRLAFEIETELARMFGRVGWIVSATALVSQVVVVPLLLPRKRLALILPPIAMAAAAVGLSLLPTAGGKHAWSTWTTPPVRRAVAVA